MCTFLEQTWRADADRKTTKPPDCASAHYSSPYIGLWHPAFAPDNHKSHMINCNPAVAAGAIRALQAFIHTFLVHKHQNPGGLSPELNSDTPFFEFHTAPLAQTL